MNKKRGRKERRGGGKGAFAKMRKEWRGEERRGQRANGLTD